MAVACLLFVLAGLGLVAFLEDRTQLHAMVPLDKPPAVLVAEARSILAAIGITDPPVDESYGFHYFPEYLDHLEEEGDGSDRWEPQANDRPTAIGFWYRRSPRPLIPNNSYFRVRDDDPPARISGMAEVALDSRGRLFKLQVIPPQKVDRPKDDPESFPAADWSILFDAAELDPGAFTAVVPEWQPELFCDRRSAWSGTYPDQPDSAIRVEACSFRGQPVYFEIMDDWLSPWRMEEFQLWGDKANAVSFGATYLIAMAGALFLARRNLRLGRGDRRGAIRLGLIIFLAYLGAIILQASHLFGIEAEIWFFMGAVGTALHEAALIILLYLALEPFIRRRWPETLISWTRALDGRWRDPRVGRDLLIGATMGVSILLIWTMEHLFPGWLGWAPNWPGLIDTDSLLGSRFVLGEMFYSVRHSLVEPIGMVFVLVFARFLLRRQWLAVGIAVVLFSLIGNLDAEYLVVMIPFNLLAYSILVFTMVRFGLLAVIMAFFVAAELVDNYPVTLDFSAWYASGSILPLLLTIAFVFFCFYISLGGRPVFAEARLQEDTA